MGIETVLFKSEEKKSAKEVADVLRLIAEKIEDTTMTLQQGTETIDIAFPETMVLELKVEEEQGRKLKRSFEIELEWIVGEERTGATTIR